MHRYTRLASAVAAGVFLSGLALMGAEPTGGPGGGGPGGPGGGRPGGGGFGPGMGRQDIKILARFDKDTNGYLDQAERKAARAALKTERPQGGGPRGPRMGGGEAAKPIPGAKVTQADARIFPDAKLYDSATLRTFFLEFEDADWEAQMEEFHGTDVEVPATLTVDGKRYDKVGVSFRGASSYFMIGAGSKRSLNISMDLAHAKQRLYGYKSLNLLNSHEDPSFIHAPLALEVMRRYIPAPKGNMVKVAINGENWGVYASVQQFNKEMLAEWYPKATGARWKVPGSPGGGGSLAYLGEDLAPYRRLYSIKTKEDPKAWAALVNLCKTLNQTPADQLEAKLRPILDIDQALWWLAIEMVILNGDGYWTRASDYNIFQDEKGVFHFIPHDANETFGPAMMMGFGGGRGGRGGRGGGFGPGGGPGGPGGGPGGFGPGGPPLQAEVGPNQPRGGANAGAQPGFGPGGQGGPGGVRGGGLEVDPLISASDANKPLISKLLAVPKFRQQYLRNVRTVATEWLDWNKIGPIATQYHNLIDAEVKADTRKLSSYEAFAASLDAPAAAAAANPEGPGRGFGPGRGGPKPSIKTFAEKRREYLLNHHEIKKLD